MKFATKAVRAGIFPDPSTGAIIPPIYQTATFALDEIGKHKGFDYSRSSNPTRSLLEANLAALEGVAYASAFASGTSAIDAITRLLSAGDHVIAPDDVYASFFRMFDKILSRYGLSISFVDTSNPDAIRAAILPNTKMVWVEMPSNPLLKITDLDAVAEITTAHDLLFVVDSTFASPYLLRPIAHGADLVLHSTSKYLSGHNQLIGGAVVTDRDDLHEEMHFMQKSIGAIPGPFDCWLTLMGLKTLPLRMEKHSANAMIVAKYLEAHPKIGRVIYPGLPSHPQHEIAKRLMDDYSGMITFELKGDVQSGINLMNTVKLCLLAESLGAVETMITHPASMTHASLAPEVRRKRGLTDTLVRLSVGIEDVEDIIEDLSQALAKA